MDRRGHFSADRWRQRRQRLNGRGRTRNHWPSVPAAAEPVWFPGKGNTPLIDRLRVETVFWQAGDSKESPKVKAEQKISGSFNLILMDGTRYTWATLWHIIKLVHCMCAPGAHCVALHWRLPCTSGLQAPSAEGLGGRWQSCSLFNVYEHLHRC